MRYTYEKDQEIGNRYWILDPDGDYILDLYSEEQCLIILSHLNRQDY
jgi:hypothetical protein